MALESEGLDCNNVLQWEGRSKRQRIKPPVTYWEEFVETDEWYKKKLVEDVPSEEMYAALEDSDFEDDEGEQGEEDESETEEDIPTIDVDYGSETTEHSEGSEA